ncbi:hypothetical protein HPP92_019969 [Vanilla planifolia]|uniref:Methyltransferase-like protein 2 n=1 Tax=Vanilla planifolia TaxID=51239 RepID=A0A835UMA3_VANPL|nr:hypothetical protein HPP92_019969 [Vanilla planifolia]
MRVFEGKELSDDLSSFFDSGIYRLPGRGIVFVDPVRLLNASYSHHRISASGYYSRTFNSLERRKDLEASDSSSSKKRKLKKRNNLELNKQEIVSEKRHQEARPVLLKAHEALLGTVELINFLPNLVKDEFSFNEVKGQNFVALGSLWQAPLYEISLCLDGSAILGEGLRHESIGKKIVPLFNNVICNNTSDDMDAEFLNCRYVLPRKSSFCMSDLREIHDLIPGCSDQGFNLIVIDPPWENGSAYQKAMYPTLPNRYFLYLPIKQLAHTNGALVVLWMTNRGKLRAFVDEELFPAWGVTDVRTSYWLKVKPDGSLLGDLDLFHHRPYEYLLLGYVNKKKAEPLLDDQVFISIPGAFSRKPPLGKLLADYVPGTKPWSCLELFARDLVDGWTAWGNEPLRFQDSSYFVKREQRQVVHEASEDYS